MLWKENLMLPSEIIYQEKERKLHVLNLSSKASNYSFFFSMSDSPNLQLLQKKKIHETILEWTSSHACAEIYIIELNEQLNVRSSWNRWPWQHRLNDRALLFLKGTSTLRLKLRKEGWRRSLEWVRSYRSHLKLDLLRVVRACSSRYNEFVSRLAI